MENNTNAKIMGGLVLAGAIIGSYFLFKKGGLDGLSGYFDTNNLKTLDDLKKQYYKLAKKYHPDTDTGSKEDFQALANEYEKLFKKLLNGSNLSSDEKKTEIEIDANLRKIYESIMHLPGIEVELAGQWLWVSGQTYPIREELKKADFKFASKKKMWYYPGVEAGGRGNFSMTDIRNKYGSVRLQTARQDQLNGVGYLDKAKLVKSMKALKTSLRKRKSVGEIPSGYIKSSGEPSGYLSKHQVKAYNKLAQSKLLKSMKAKQPFKKLSGLGSSLRSYPIPLNQAAKKIMLKILSVMESKGDATYRKFDNSEGTFMPLSVEIIGNTKMGREISLAHYYEQNGDLMADPEMIFLEVEGEFYPAYYKQDGLGLEKYSIKYDSEKMIGYNRALQKDQTQFANMWLKNIKDQQEL